MPIVTRLIILHLTRADLSMLHTASKMGEEGRQYIRDFFREQDVCAGRWSGVV